MQVNEVPLGWPDQFPPKPPPRLEGADTERERNPSDRRQKRFSVFPQQADAEDDVAPERVPAYAGKLDLMA
jgi:hypothetical protein